jgi:hypothetical protein
MALRCFRSACCVLSTALLILSLPGTVRADNSVLQGWDLFETLPGTVFNGVPFTGVPLGTFDFTKGTFGDFGRGIGTKPVDGTDTIVKRLDIANAPSEVIRAEMVALQLMSTVPANFGLGVGTYFITLQSERGGPATVGNMTIDFGPEGIPHGTFDSFFDVFFDVRLGGLNGPIALSDHLLLTQSDAPWSHFPLLGELLIQGVNDNLNGQNNLNDFHPLAILQEVEAGAVHVVKPAGAFVPLQTVPEPSSMALFGFGTLAMLGLGLRRVRRSS